MKRSGPMTQSDDAASGRLTALLEGAAGGRDGQAWSDLWTELYHNGSLDVSDPQVWRALTDMAEGVDADTASAALHLAGALLVQADRRHETRDLRDRHAPEVARLLAAAHRRRPATADRNDYCVLLETLVNLEGDVHWAEDLFWGIAGEEYELECPDPDCCAELWVVIGERASSGTSQDDVCSDDADTVPLQPAAPGALDGLGRRLYELALADGQEDVADALTHAFGAATCPECGGRVSVVAHLMARSG